MRFDEVIAIWTPDLCLLVPLSICTQNLKSKFASLKIGRLILRIPLNTIENGVSENFNSECL